MREMPSQPFPYYNSGIGIFSASPPCPRLSLSQGSFPENYRPYDQAQSLRTGEAEPKVHSSVQIEVGSTTM